MHGIALLTKIDGGGHLGGGRSVINQVAKLFARIIMDPTRELGVKIICVNVLKD